METALAINEPILLLLTVIAAVALVVSLTSEPSSKNEEPQPKADQASRWRVFRILPEALHDHETEKSAVVADEVGGVRLLARPFAGQGWELSLQGREGERRGRERRTEALNLEITRRGLLTSRFCVSLDGKPWVSVRADKAGALGVRYVLEGSVRRAGQKLRINAQLIDAESGSHLWADRYDGDMEDIFTLQDEITEKIVSALEVNLTAQEKAAAGAHLTDSFEAYELYLRGRSAFFQFTPEAND